MNTQPLQRIAVRGVNWLGDAVMSTPALQRLREAHPGAHITLITHEKLKSLWLDHPDINAVQTFVPGESAWRLGRRLRAEKFDVALILPNSPRSALEFWFAGIPERIGYARPWRNWFLTRRVAPRAGALEMHKRSVAEINHLTSETATLPRPALPPTAHHIHQYLHLAAALGANPNPVPPRLVVSDETTHKFLTRSELAGGPSPGFPWFGLNAGAEYGPAKRWPEDRFSEAAIQIQRRVKCGWVIFGLPEELELANRIAGHISHANVNVSNPAPAVLNLAGKTSLAELCAALKLCRVLLTNDSGPMHLAAALGTPVVVPFGSTSPELTGPGLPGDSRHACLRASAACSPCFLRACPIDFRCMTGISVDRVVTAVLNAGG